MSTQVEGGSSTPAAFVVPELPRGYFFRVRYLTKSSAHPLVEVKRSIWGRWFTEEIGYEFSEPRYNETAEQGVYNVMLKLKKKYFEDRRPELCGDYPPKRVIGRDPTKAVRTLISWP